LRTDDWVARARASYDRVACAYSSSTCGALAALPIERALLELFAQRVLTTGGGPVLDAGCGPGWVTAHLAQRGLDICGMDLSPALVDIARLNQPGLDFWIGSVTELAVADNALTGLVCWYVLHHVPDHALAAVLEEFARALAPGGQLLLGGHSGEGSYLKTQGYGGIPMSVIVNRRSNDSIVASLRRAGFAVDAHVVIGAHMPGVTGIVFATKESES
jgi:SAM-dependent methyltransferase